MPRTGLCGVIFAKNRTVWVICAKNRTVGCNICQEQDCRGNLCQEQDFVERTVTILCVIQSDWVDLFDRGSWGRLQKENYK